MLPASMGLINAGRIAVRTEFDSYDQAMDTLDNIITAFDYHMIYNIGGDTYANYDSVYSSLDEVRKATIKGLSTLAADLARVKDYPISVNGISTLLIAYEQYKDLDREPGIQTQNKNIFHPGFIPIGKIDILDA